MIEFTDNQDSNFPEDLPRDIRIMEVSIPIEIQHDFLARSSELREKQSDSVEIDIETIIEEFPQKTDIEIRKTDIVKLAFSGSVKAFRFLEKECENDCELIDYFRFGHQLCKIILENSLGETSTSFVSSGLGGKGEKMRYFATIFPNDSTATFNAFQKKIVSSEFTTQIEKFDGEIEKIELNDDYISIVILLSIHEPLDDIIRSTIENCNEFGDYIFKGFMATNISIPSEEEIITSIEKIRIKSKEKNDKQQEE